ncbi:MAG: glycosyltransferase family 4 protein, partial [Planctomycetaceae bacterium]|nr:glycosyltransferase family 4 protein [Planctomycetaceae bacterium]
TPITVDEDDLSTRRIFLGGISIYMESKSRLWHRLPRAMTRWLDNPWILKLASRLSISNDAKDLGELTIASLQGIEGPQDREVKELINFLCDELRPEVICFSNILQTGVVKSLRQKYTGKLYCVLQGDDIFLNDLTEPYQSQAIEMISRIGEDFDGFITHSHYYQDYISNLLRLPKEKFHQLPLGIDLTPHTGQPKIELETPFSIGYFARVCPEKGFHHALKAFSLLHQEHPNSKLLIGGYLGSRDRNFYEEQMSSVAKLGEAVKYLGSPETQQEKVEIFNRFDVFSMPTTYHEPKGLPVMEAWANGVPVVQPAHGAFPEMIEHTHGGMLVSPENPEELASAWLQLATNHDQRVEYAQAGHRGVREHYSLETMVAESERIFAAPD